MLTPSMLWHKLGFVIFFCDLNVVGPSFMCGDLVICMKALISRTKGRGMTLLYKFKIVLCFKCTRDYNMRSL